MDEPGRGSLDCCRVAIQRGGHIKALTTVIFDRLRECRR
jgi:hypothetical protein